jgi:hypothetical protein
VKASGLFLWLFLPGFLKSFLFWKIGIFQAFDIKKKKAFFVKVRECGFALEKGTQIVPGDVGRLRNTIVAAILLRR